MYQNLKVDSIIDTKQGKAKIRRIGPISRNERSPYGWAILTLDLNGEVAYCAARDVEIEA